MNIHPDHIPENLLVATDVEGRFVGYVQTGVFKSAVAYSAEAVEARVIAYGSIEGLTEALQADIAKALLQGVIAKMDNSKWAHDNSDSGEVDVRTESILRLEVAQDPAVMQALKTLLTAKKEHRNASGMVRMLHRENLLRGLIMGWNDQWITAGRPSGTLTFTTPYGPVTLDAEETFLRVHTDNSTGVEILSQATFFCLLFGMLLPENATTNTALHPLLAALFPPQNAIYYGADGF